MMHADGSGWLVRAEAEIAILEPSAPPESLLQEAAILTRIPFILELKQTLNRRQNRSEPPTLTSPNCA